MRSNKLHTKADIILLGYTNPAVHSFLDASVKTLGPSHRRDNHDYRAVQLFEAYYGKKESNIALLHILLDDHILDDKLVMKIIKEKVIK